MRIPKYLYRTVFTLFSILSMACNNIPGNVEGALVLAGENRGELDKVIEHYRSLEDSLKLRAAYFLIGNMATKYTKKTVKKSPYDILIKKLDSINQDIPYVTYGQIDSIWTSIKIQRQLGPNGTSIEKDIGVITADFLIKNIDSAFNIWRTRPWAAHLGFDDFCEYILPYRSTHEPLCDWRSAMLKEFAWLEDSLKIDTSPLSVCGRINDSIKWFNFNQTFYELPDLGLEDMSKTRYGKCVDMSNYANFAMRANGVPVATLYTPFGTSWNMVLDEDGVPVTFLGTHENPVKEKKYSPEERMAKVYKLTYANKNPLHLLLSPRDIPKVLNSPNIEDVTREHIPSKSIKVKIDKTLTIPTSDYVFLCVYEHRSRGWEAVHWGKLQDNREFAVFTDMGLERIYHPMFYINGTYRSAAPPFYLDNNGDMTTFTPDHKSQPLVRLRRKFPLNVHEISNSRTFVGARFQGANSVSFKDAKDLLTIKQAPDHFEEAVIKKHEKFRYVRLRYREDTFMPLAELAFYSSDNKAPVKGRVLLDISRPLDKVTPSNAFDGDIRTNVDSEKFKNPGKYNWIGMDLGRPTRIRKVKYLFRNSFNTIEPGDNYELFYWEDRSWKSLGRKKAMSDYLDYNVPKNALFLLKNHSRGIEEMVFFIKNGKQIWG